MDNEKIQSLISQLKGIGLEDEKILDIFYEVFQEGKMDRKDLEELADSLGYELDDDFKKDEHKDPIEGGDEKLDTDLAEKAEDLKEIKPGESKEEFKEKVEDAADDVKVEDEDKVEDKVEDDGDDEKAEEDEVMKKYFKL